LGVVSFSIMRFPRLQRRIKERKRLGRLSARIAQRLGR
jgi:hypothetical protein